jgi:RNA polymerase-binding protein DksA
MAPSPRRTDIDFEEFRKMLLEERGRIVQVRDHQREISQIVENKSEQDITDGINTDSEETAETSFLIYEHDRQEALDENEEALIEQIDAALARIDDGTYGICVKTGEPIPVERLRALPWASMTVEAAERAGL